MEAQGSSLENVIKVTAFLADVKAEKPAFNAAYAEFFKKDAPSRTALGIFSRHRDEVKLSWWRGHRQRYSSPIAPWGIASRWPTTCLVQKLRRLPLHQLRQGLPPPVYPSGIWK